MITLSAPPAAAQAKAAGMPHSPHPIERHLLHDVPDGHAHVVAMMAARGIGVVGRQYAAVVAFEAGGVSPVARPLAVVEERGAIPFHSLVLADPGADAVQDGGQVFAQSSPIRTVAIQLYVSC